MNLKVRNIIRDFSYTVTSNFITILISMIVVLIIPKIIGIDEYGYWQLYTFYSTYIGFLNIGWVEGIYLRYGGCEYKRLDRTIFTSQFFLFVIYNVIASALILGYSLISNSGVDEKTIISMVAITTLLVLPRGFIYYLLQATNRIKEYSKLVIIDRVIYCFIIILLLVMKRYSYTVLILADLIGKLITLLMSIYIAREVILYRVNITKGILKEISVNISVGFKLMIANVSSMLIVGVTRFGIEKQWGIEAFAKVSLTMSISNLLMVFINAIGIVIFPLLRRIPEKKLPDIYKMLSILVMVPVLFILGLYYPVKIILSQWLPQYSDSLRYMALLFPICIYESKMAMLINTYLKALRKEKQILWINICAVIVSIIFSSLTILVFKSLELAIVSIVCAIAFRGVIAEKYLSKILKIKVNKDVIIEVLMTVIFIFTAWYIDGIYGCLFYYIAYIGFVISKFKEIKEAKESIIKLSK